MEKNGNVEILTSEKSHFSDGCFKPILDFFEKMLKEAAPSFFCEQEVRDE